jgi:hypothetical protein
MKQNIIDEVKNCCNFSTAEVEVITTLIENKKPKILNSAKNNGNPVC